MKKLKSKLRQRRHLWTFQMEKKEEDVFNPRVINRRRRRR